MTPTAPGTPETPVGGPRIYLGLAIHNHQPVGNFPSVFARAYEQAYLPMVEALERHPAIRLSLHYSGPLLDWLVRNQPGFLERVAALAGRGQVEIMGGAYYEPILPLIPEADRLGQINKMREFCRANFGREPAGLWLAERVWEPSLPASMARAGVQWTVVDDTHFKMVGLGDDDLFGYYMTEDQGHMVKVFATSKFLRYAVPFKMVEDVLEYLRRNASETQVKIAVMGDDGEKFGVWPQTYEHCWGRDGWIEGFFRGVEQSAPWLQTVMLGEFANLFPPLGLAYLPCASYDEMLEWALPAGKSQRFIELKKSLEKEGREDIAAFMHGGFWRHYLVKYPEVNWMHKKMLRVHRKVYQPANNEPRGLDHLWQAQCNCPYWHGIFGGLYLADIRAVTYQHLIDAERQADAAMGRAGPWLELQQTDFDGDGHEEVVVDAASLGLVVSPQSGGSLVEWDLHRPGFNLLSALARRPEAYHRDLLQQHASPGGGGTETIHAAIRMKDPRAARLLAYDRHPRLSLLDHVLAPQATLQQFAAADYEELADLAAFPYECAVETTGRAARMTLRRLARLRQAGQMLPFEVRKTIAADGGKEALDIAYHLENLSDQAAQGVFCIEWNINLLGGGHNEQAYYEVPGGKLDDTHLDSWGELVGVDRLVLGNRYLGIRLELRLDPGADVWRFPVETVSNSEAGVEGLYQASCLLVRLRFSLLPGRYAGINLGWRQL